MCAAEGERLELQQDVSCVHLGHMQGAAVGVGRLVLGRGCHQLQAIGRHADSHHVYHHRGHCRDEEGLFSSWPGVGARCLPKSFALAFRQQVP